jgi:hypothetical protein
MWPLGNAPMTLGVVFIASGARIGLGQVKAVG